MSGQQRAVVFDIGRVLFRWQLRALYKKLIADPAELEEFLANVVTEEWHFRHDRGESIADMLTARVKEFPQHALLIAAWAARFNETIPGPVAGTHELVRRLHQRAVPLYCLTNFGDELFEAFRKEHPIFDLFEDIIVSGAEKIAKPDPRIYEITEARTGRSGAALFFTDDNPTNVDAARKRGWDAHVFTGAAALKDQLKASGFL